VKNHTPCSALDAGQRAAAIQHMPVIDIDFEIGLSEGAKKLDYKTSDIIKANIDDNKTYSLHKVKSVSEMMETLNQIHNGGGAEALKRTSVRCGGLVKPLEECLDANRNTLKIQLESQAYREYRFSMKERHSPVTKGLFPKIALLNLNENDRIVSPDEVNELGGTVMVIAMPCVKFSSPEDKTRPDNMHREGSPENIGWIVPTTASIGKTSDYQALIAKINPLKPPRQLTLKI
jgi:hypothetical protein